MFQRLLPFQQISFFCLIPLTQCPRHTQYNASLMSPCSDYQGVSCCSPSYAEVVRNHTDFLSKFIKSTLQVDLNSQKTCATQLRKLLCFPCGPSQNNWLSVYPKAKGEINEEVDLTICDSFCDVIYNGCRDVIVTKSGKPVKEEYGLSAHFCRNHFKDILRVQDGKTQGLCYPGPMAGLFLVLKHKKESYLYITLHLSLQHAKIHIMVESTLLVTKQCKHELFTHISRGILIVME